MNNKYIIVLIGLPLFIIGVVVAFYIGRITTEKQADSINGLYSTNINENNGDVYICTGPNAKKYHTTPSSRWLENCSGEVKKASLSEAESQGKTPCRGCYSN